MNQFERGTLEITEQVPTGPYEAIIFEFLGEVGQYLSPEAVEKIAQEAGVFEARLIANEGVQNPENQKVSYDKYTKSFLVNGKPVTKGQIVASRHLQDNISLPIGEGLSLEEKTLKRIYHEKKIQDFVSEKINTVLARNLATEMTLRDALKSKAYSAIAQRLENKSEQLGVIAEKLMYGVAEMIAIDRPDLGIKVTPANAYEDIENKIDFIIESTQKRRGANIESKDFEPQHKSVGIQFTINTSKQEHKSQQIEKAKGRGVHVDDIVYVAIESSMLRKALQEWQVAGKPISGPWGYLSKEARQKAIEGLFHSVLTEEQEKSLINKM